MHFRLRGGAKWIRTFLFMELLKLPGDTGVPTEQKASGVPVIWQADHWVCNPTVIMTLT